MTLTSVVRESTSTAAASLDRARAIVGPELEAAVSRLSPELHAAVRHHLAGGGKYVRAGLVLASAAACGAGERAGLAGAVAVELVHNFSLIHDDIVDGDLERRHRPTVWAHYGVGPAIITGDALVTLAFEVLLDEPSQERLRAARRLASATQTMISGQAEDMAFEVRASIGVGECLRMGAAKTGALLSAAASLGAVLGGAPDAQVEALAEFGKHLGIAFQAVDDVLGIWGDPEKTGKPVGNDLRMHKKTLPIALAVSQVSDGADELVDLLGRADLTDEQVARAARLLDERGMRQRTLGVGESHLDTALGALNRVRLPDQARFELEAIARYVTARNR